jgi:hypothetical protein
VVALEEVLCADLPVRLGLRLRALEEAQRVDVDPGLGEPLRHVLEALGEWLGVRVRVHEDERPPGVHPQRDEAELVRVDAAFALRARRGEETPVEAVRPRVVRALEGRALPGSLADERAAVTADVQERVERSFLVPHDDDRDSPRPRREERARLGDFVGASGVLPGALEDPPLLEVEDCGVRVPAPGKGRDAVDGCHGATLAAGLGSDRRTLFTPQCQTLGSSSGEESARSFHTSVSDTG